LHLLVDTSTWLDLAKRRDGQRWIVVMRLLVDQRGLRLLVPDVVIAEFERNRDRVETTMTTTVAQRFKPMKQDLGDYGGRDYEQALGVIEGLAHEVPLIGVMTTRNFNDVLGLLRNGTKIDPTNDQRSRVVQRGLEKKAPFHRSRNSVADALLIEMLPPPLTAPISPRPPTHLSRPTVTISRCRTVTSESPILTSRICSRLTARPTASALMV